MCVNQKNFSSHLVKAIKFTITETLTIRRCPKVIFNILISTQIQVVQKHNHIDWISHTTRSGKISWCIREETLSYESLR